MGCTNSKEPVSSVVFIQSPRKINHTPTVPIIEDISERNFTPLSDPKRKVTPLPDTKRKVTPLPDTKQKVTSLPDKDHDDLDDDIECIEMSSSFDPPVKATKQKNEHLDRSKFEKIDKYAIETPDEVVTSVANLALYLSKAVRSELEKVRAIFRWMTQHISYDTTIFKINGKTRAQDPESILKRRNAVCEGYSTLFLALCGEMKVPCKKISGFSKAMGYDPESTLTYESRTDHAWNIVYVAGDWWPMDVTWASGTVDKKTYKFKRDLNELYFLTNPKDFVIKHFPYMKKSYEESCHFQLLQRPLTLDEFNKDVSPHNAGIEWGFECKTHGQVVDFDKVCELQIKTSRVQLDDVTCQLKDVKSGKDFKEYVLLRNLSSGVFSVKVSPPKPGKFDLTLYGKKEQDSDGNKAMASFVLRCKSVMLNVTPYPEHSGSWGLKSVARSYGFHSEPGINDVVNARAGRAELRMKVESNIQPTFQLKHSQSDREDLDQYFMAFLKDGFLTVKFRFPIAGYFRFRVFAKELQSSKTQLEYIGDILIKTKDAYYDLLPFPKHTGLWGLKPDSSRYGILSTKHRGEEVQAQDGEIVMTFNVKQDIRVSFKLSHSESDNSKLTNFLMACVEESTMTITVRPPVPGYFNLQLFAKDLEGDSSKNDFIGQFLLSCSDPCEDVHPYPKHHGLWSVSPKARDYGFNSDIFKYRNLSTSTGEVSFKLPIHVDASVKFDLKHAVHDISCIDRYVFWSVKNGLLSVMVRLPQAGFYKLTMYASKNMSGPLESVADYLIESKADVSVQPFPQTYTKANYYGFTLIEPLTGDIPANQQVRFRMSSELALRLMIDKTLYTKGENNEFDLTITTPKRKETITVYGSSEESGKLDGIYTFTCV